MHLAMVTDHFALVVGDRLLTVDTGGVVSPWDPRANKTMLLLTLNGVVIVSYAGLGHINGEPTDQWLLRNVTGKEFGDPMHPGGGPPLSYFPPMGLHLGAVLERIQSAVLRDLRHQHVPRAQRRLEVLIVGWTWKRRNNRRMRSHVYSLDSADGGRRLDIQRSERIYARFQGTRKVGILAGAGSATRAHFERIRREASQLATIDEVEAMIVQVMREAGDEENSSVGTDLVSCLLPAYLDWPRVRYFWDDRPAANGAPLAHTPAIASEGMVMPPFSFTGEMPTIVFGDVEEEDPYRILIECIPPLPETLPWGGDSSPRRRFDPPE